MATSDGGFELSAFPLHDAAQRGDIEGLKAALGSGIDVNARETDRQWTALHVAAETNQVEAVRFLTDNGAHVDARDKDDDTPLHCAAFVGHTDCVGWLLAAGAAPKLHNKYGMTAHDVAVRNGRSDTAQVLAEEGGV